MHTFHRTYNLTQTTQNKPVAEYLILASEPADNSTLARPVPGFGFANRYLAKRRLARLKRRLTR